LLPNKRTRKHKKVFHVCQFEGCNKEYYAVHQNKYCEEHVKSKYKKVLYCKAKIDPIEDVKLHNVYIKHDYVSSLDLRLNCDCCGKPYQIKLLPRQFVYPKYCETHRNNYKRELFQKKSGISS